MIFAITTKKWMTKRKIEVDKSFEGQILSATSFTEGFSKFNI